MTPEQQERLEKLLRTHEGRLQDVAKRHGRSQVSDAALQATRVRQRGALVALVRELMAEQVRTLPPAPASAIKDALRSPGWLTHAQAWDAASAVEQVLIDHGICGVAKA
ncbi:hypothetical protein [Delftia tsuruhatensis]|uniref:hypothetical protein n=1 Tax=Delftia tsuruhatensis TaxID=180282 RepID=UPI0030CFA8F2